MAKGYRQGYGFLSKMQVRENEVTLCSAQRKVKIRLGFSPAEVL